VFGWITGGTFLPSPLGRLVRECWLSLPVLHPQCGLDAFALMPDHLHALVHFTRPRRMVPAGTPGSAGARGGLGTVVRHFKSAVTIAARQQDLTYAEPLWQRGYFERIVGSEKMLATVREYIVHNALKEAVHAGGRPCQAT
jgi:REP element-mobilizing transposase RayT